ncbi:MAG TPA: ABC transporter permease [Patescibacteria group bacterium]|nr:ABC transporter permease [Patescibacteria group bacterium]
MNKKSFLPVWVFAKISIRRAFRDKLAIFFIFLFPLIFLFVFGGIFGKSGHDVSFRVAFINQSQSTFADNFAQQIKNSKTFKVDPKATTLDEAKEKMSRSQLDAAIVLPTDFGEQKNGHPAGEATIVYTQNNEQAGQTLATVLDGQVFKSINERFGRIDTPFTVKGERLNNKSLTQFDYTFAGLLGFSIIGLGIFGPINFFPEMKKQGVLRRLHTTPLKVWQFFVANVLSQAVIGIISLAMQFVVAMTVFHLRVTGSFLELAIFLIFSIMTIFGIGMAIGGWAQNERQAQPLGNLVVFPMMFLSGTFFPRFLMPEWLQKVSSFLPLTPVIDGIRLIATEGKHLTDLGAQLGLMAVWLFVVYWIAFRVFRWE